MKIHRVKLSESQTSVTGLKEINLDRLGAVVALIGKNGSGKTRILNLIETNIPNITKLDDFINGNVIDAPASIRKHLEQLQPLKDLHLKIQELSKIRAARQTNPNDKDLAKSFQTLRQIIRKEGSSLIGPELSGQNPQIPLQSVENAIKRVYEQANSTISRIAQDYIKRIDYNQIRQLQDAIAEKDDDSNSFEQLIESVTDQLEYNEIGSIYKSSLRFLKKLPHQLSYDWLESTGSVEKFQTRVSYKRFISFKDIFEKIFGKTLEWETQKITNNITLEGVTSTSKGTWKIQGREFNYSEFSEGEKTLFAYVLMFFLMSQNGNIRLKESIIIIDEPELHLHPDAEIDLLNGIRNIIEEKGQLWIATHSLNILSHLNFEEVFTVKNGVIKHPTRTIQHEALLELLRIEERVQKLSEFLTSISEWTYVHFMIECFTHPEVIEVAHKNDPQIKSLKEFLNLPDQNEKITLLDYGAGKGRFFEQAAEDEIFLQNVEYFALEPNNEFHTILSSKGITRIFPSHQEIGNIKFDFIVLCNVLHEIEIGEWAETLNKIIDTLKEDGHLIIIEAKSLIKGERIGSIGYLLLDEEEIQSLFNLPNEALTLKHTNEYYNITSVLLPRKNLKHINNKDVVTTLKLLENNTLSKIEEVRNRQIVEPQSSNKLGREAAFLSQLHINSRLAQKNLSLRSK